MRMMMLWVVVGLSGCDTGDNADDPVDTASADQETEAGTDADDTGAGAGTGTDPLTAALSCDRPAAAVQMCDRTAEDSLCAEYAGAGFTAYDLSAECEGAPAVDWCPTAQLVGYCVQVVDADPDTRMLTYFYDDFPNVDAVTAAFCVDNMAISSVWCPYP